MAEGGKDERDQNRRWWNAINMSPENKGAWFRDKNIDYQKYNKWSNEVSKGWREGGNSESFRNSPYNKLGLLMSGVVSLPILPMLVETLPSNPYTWAAIKGAAGYAGKQGLRWLWNQGKKKAVQIAFGVGSAELAYDQAVPYLEKYKWFNNIQDGLRKIWWNDYEGAQAAKKKLDEYKADSDNFATYSNKLFELNNDKHLIDSGEDYSKLYEKYGVNNDNDLRYAIKKASLDNTIGLYQLQLKYDVLNGQQFNKSINDRYKKSAEQYNNGMSQTRLAKTINNTAIIGNVIGSTLKSDYAKETPFWQSAFNSYLDGANVAFLKGLWSNGAGPVKVAASELLPAYAQSYVNDGVIGAHKFMQDNWKWYNDNVDFNYVGLPAAFLFGVPANKAASGLLNKASNAANTGINTYLRYKHGEPSITSYDLTPEGKLKFDGTLYPDGYKASDTWWHTPETSNYKLIRDNNGNWVWGNSETGEVWMYSPNKSKLQLNE